MRTEPVKSVGFLLVLLAGTVLVTSCSLNQIAINAVANVLSGDGGSSTFTTDDDPELVGASLPFALKMYETLLEQTPDHEGLLLATGTGFISYANAFVATPASMLSYEQWEKQQADQIRAKKLYIRGRDYLIHALHVRYPGFTDALESTEPDAVEQLQLILDEMDTDDVPYLYWIGAGWVAAFSLDAFDLELAFTVTKAHALVLRALELDEAYSDGAIHDFLVQYYASLPPSMGGDKEKAEFHHQRALELADGRLAGPYVSYAESIVLPRQASVEMGEDLNAYAAGIQAVADEFVALMEQALAVDPDAYPDARLVNILTQRKARWYLEHLDEFFLLDFDTEGDAF
ncbi:MAG: TRAP transporter TatT component family protein [Spirochaetales bacterium]|nr:TRAP transporter TatT component family protein [Spirochaetales bacterium]